MNLESQEVKQLAEFFARRYPEPARRAAFASAARVRMADSGPTDPVAAWERLIATAQSTGRLAPLTRATAASDPTDENLQQVAKVFGDQPGLARRVAVSAAIGSAVGAVALVLLIGLSSNAPPDPSADAALTTAPHHATQTMSVGVPAELAPPAQGGTAMLPTVLAAANRPETAPPDAAPPDAAPPNKTARTARVAAVWSADRGSDRCTSATAGAVVGYWYGGAAPPGAAGDTIQITKSMNVRSDYPDRHNGYDRRTQIRCVLRAGDQVTLSQAPIKVPGDRYWVPLTSGDLQTPDSDASASL